MRIPKMIFAESRGVLFVMAKMSGMHPLIPFIDGLALHSFKGKKPLYMKLDDVIAWHEKELKETSGRSGNEKLMEAFKVARTKLIAQLASSKEQASDQEGH